MMDLITSILAITVRAGTSLVFATIGEILTERAGILNLGIEGIMLMGAVTGFAASFYSQNLLVALLVAMAVGATMAALHAFLTVTMRANQVVSGLSITLFGSGFASFLGQRLGPAANNFSSWGSRRAVYPRRRGSSVEDPDNRSPLQPGHPDLRGVPPHSPLLVLPLQDETRALAALHRRGSPNSRRHGHRCHEDEIFLHDPRRGPHRPGRRPFVALLHARVVGKHHRRPRLDRHSPRHFSMWNPARSIWGALLFGGINAVQFRLQASGTNIPAAFLNMLPYLGTIVVLVLMTWWEALSKKIGAPAALGSAYMREDK